MNEVGITGPVKFSFNTGNITRKAMAFWCVMLPRKLIREIGLLDEVFDPGMGEDGDFSIKAQLRGYELVQTPVDYDLKFGDGVGREFPIIHIGSGTFGWTDSSGIIKRNKALLDDRYGSRLEDMYNYGWKQLNGDISEHFPVLRKYASECSHVTEFGTRGVVSTYALMAAKPKKLLTYDLVPNGHIWTAASVAKENDIEFGFMERDTTAISIEPTDLLFIDTLHTYSQLQRELTLHASNVRKYLIFHDTVSFGYKDEVGDGPGLMTAIEEFLGTHGSEWVLKERLENNNGLVVLQRIANPVKYSVIIPTYNHCDDLLKPCLESIIQYTDLSNVEVIVVANGCVDNTREYVQSLDSKVFKLVWIDEPSGYTKSTNAGMKVARGDYLILLNNDTQLLEQNKNDWLNILEKPFLEKKSMGMTGPLELFDRYANMPVLIFFCVMISRELYNKLGPLDEIFHPGGGEDIDYTARAKLAGYEAVCVDRTVYNGITNVGWFPMWHKDNRTFSEMPEYTQWIIKRNGHTNCKRYNKDIKLNIGAGGSDYEGFLSVDLYDKRAHIKMDITKLDFEDNSVSEILASHVFEHLNPYHAVDILKEWLRVLKPGGKLVMEMPDIEGLCKRFVEGSKGERYGILNAIYGSVNTTNVGGPDEITSPHLFGWWPESMYDHLRQAGFDKVEFMPEKIPHPETNFRVEAKKPKVVLTQLDKLEEQDSRVFQEIFVNNEYGVLPGELSGKVVLDIGANKGFFSFKALEDGAQNVVAVEANPRVFRDFLIPNFRKEDRVIVMNYAIHSVDGVELTISDNDTMSTIGREGYSVTSKCLETLSNLPGELVLKMDVETAEFEALLPTPMDVIRRFERIYIEIHGCEKGPAEVIKQKMRDCGFVCEVSNQYWSQSAEFPEVYSAMDVFVEKWKRV